MSSEDDSGYIKQNHLQNLSNVTTKPIFVGIVFQPNILEAKAQTSC